MKSIRKSLVLLSLFVGLSILPACFSITHEVGAGAQGSKEVEKRQWYALWGLVALNDVDSKALAEGATDYTVKTERNALDFLIGLVAGFVTVTSQTVTVTK